MNINESFGILLTLRDVVKPAGVQIWWWGWADLYGKRLKSETKSLNLSEFIGPNPADSFLVCVHAGLAFEIFCCLLYLTGEGVMEAGLFRSLIREVRNIMTPVPNAK